MRKNYIASSAKKALKLNGTDIDDLKNLRRTQRDAFEEFFAAMESLNKDDVEPLDEEFDTILADRVNIYRELDL